MHPLHFTDSARAAATHLLHTTPLCFDLEDHWTDDGKVLTITANVDTWTMMSTGTRILFDVLEQIAGQRSTVTLLDIGRRLDAESRAAVHHALGLFWMLPVSEVAS